MTQYYSKTTNGFCDDRVMGPRLVSIIDPLWVAPTITVDDPSFTGTLAEGEAVPTITIPDPNAEPVYTFVDNPYCKIPVDAIEITEEERQACLTGQSSGKVIQADADGRPVAIDPVYTPSQLALDQIHTLESSVTPRMIQEAITGCTDLNKNTGKTSAQDLADIRTQITTLRAQLTS